MIVLDCEQGSPEWIQARLGIPTASRFDQILTPKTLKPSASAHGYMCECMAEYMIGEPLDQATDGYMRRGTKMEDLARKWYELQNDCDVRQVGLCLRDDGRAACSPDGLVGDDGGVEIKVPGAKKHVGYMLEPGDLVRDYWLQIQGGLWITDRQWWDVLSYNPAMESVLQRVMPDAEVHALFEEHVLGLARQVRVNLVTLGYMQEQPT